MNTLDKIKAGAMFCLGCYNNNTTDGVASKQRKCIALSSGVWKT